MNSLLVPFNGDLYELIVDDQGLIVSAEVHRDNNSRPPELIDISEVPPEVIDKAISKLIKLLST